MQIYKKEYVREVIRRGVNRKYNEAWGTIHKGCTPMNRLTVDSVTDEFNPNAEQDTEYIINKLYSGEPVVYYNSFHTNRRVGKLTLENLEIAINQYLFWQKNPEYTLGQILNNINNDKFIYYGKENLTDSDCSDIIWNAIFRNYKNL